MEITLVTEHRLISESSRSQWIAFARCWEVCTNR